ncbi:MAG TPA: DUF6134 family protein [Geminicoccus sp.]|uniref:DUF6134 family protein n=1 Tax=Geminicoccus sp. TaxID=2024832 RepID=UPI002E2F1290|nr:DUF6134 family protein [Geminicoccus sp.]HEX2528053.1 DUF6134 family protein [Geminicoccus sp.]
MVRSRRSTLALVASAMLPTAGRAAVPADIQFEVARNGETIGTHAVRFSSVDDMLHVRIAVALDVKLLGFTVYGYRHESRETWRDGRLVALDARTDDDGDLLSVRAENQGALMLVRSVQGRAELPADMMPTSYWDRRTVQRDAWLDTQADKVIHGRMVQTGREDVETAAATVGADRYDMQGEIDLTLWYTGPDWVGLRFGPGDGSSITYRRISPLGRAG